MMVERIISISWGRAGNCFLEKVEVEMSLQCICCTHHSASLVSPPETLRALTRATVGRVVQHRASL